MLNSIYIDELKYLIGGCNYVINKHITVYNPYVYEVRDFGEDLYEYILSIFTRKPYDLAVELYDNGVDYQSITDWDLFFDTIAQNKLPIEYTCILFGKLDFSKFLPYIENNTGIKKLVAFSENGEEIVIDEVIYRKIVTYLRYMHFVSEKVEYDVGNKQAKKFLIDRMRRKKKKLLKDYELGRKKKQSNISTMIKYCVNNSNFKYTYDACMNLHLNLLYESYYFITYGNERDNVMSGVYHGTIDTSKMKDKSILNIIPDLHK